MIDQQTKMRVMDERRKKYEAMGYRFIGKNQHSAVKVCSWCKASLRGTGNCYKQKFYGLGSNQCLQMTPTFFTCSENCLFCWRPLRYALPNEQVWDSPKEIMDEAIEAQRELLMGFKGNPKANKEKFEASLLPKHVAISLSGEPTLYPMIGDLMTEIKSRGMSAFLVSNGTMPDRLQEMLDNNQQPTQMYLTLAAPDKETMQKTALPIFKDSWERLERSLAMLHKFDRSAIRFTLVRNMNFIHPEKYAAIVDQAQSDYVEVKSFMSVGGARDRLAYSDMLLFPEIQKFAREVEKHSSYKIIDEKADSRVVLLANENSANPELFFSE